MTIGLALDQLIAFVAFLDFPFSFRSPREAEFTNPNPDPGSCTSSGSGRGGVPFPQLSLRLFLGRAYLFFSEILVIKNFNPPLLSYFTFRCICPESGPRLLFFLQARLNLDPSRKRTGFPRFSVGSRADFSFCDLSLPPARFFLCNFPGPFPSFFFAL